VRGSQILDNILMDSKDSKDGASPAGEELTAARGFARAVNITPKIDA
jgi:hypothetical protein